MAVAADRTAHARATRAEISTVAGYLQDVLGQRLTAAIAGVSDAKAIGLWARGERVPHPEAVARLRNAFLVVQLLMTKESSDTVRAWFMGMNPELGDESPAVMLAQDPKGVLQAARSFLAHG